MTEGRCSIGTSGANRGRAAASFPLISSQDGCRSSSRGFMRTNRHPPLRFSPWRLNRPRVLLGRQRHRGKRMATLQRA